MQTGSQQHFWRGFLIALALGLGLPVLIMLFGLGSADTAFVVFLVIVPQLIYAFPLMMVPDLQGIGLLLSVVQMVFLAVLFGILGRRLPTARQWLMAVLFLLGWWLLCRLVALACGVSPPQPHFEM